MSDPSHPNELCRRAFLKLGSAAGLATAASGLAGGAWAQEASTPAAPSKAKHRTLGRTKLEVSIVSVGAMGTSEPAILQATFEKGVNYVDTARGYMGGQNEVIVGKALKGYRDKVYVATKFGHSNGADAYEATIKSAEESLKALEVDYIDVLQMHGISSKDNVAEPRAKEALAKLKEQGKIRFAGVTTHEGHVEVLDAVAADPDKIYDVVLVGYNFESPPEHTAAIERAAKAGIGIVAMKTQAGGYKTTELGAISPHQAALKWVLQNTNVACAIPSMVDLKQVEEDVAVMMDDLKLTRIESQVLMQYAQAISSVYCKRCGGCNGTCPLGVDIKTAHRSLMYAEGYGDMRLASATYHGIPLNASPVICGECDTCVAQCIHGLCIGERMNTARALFA